MLQVPGVIDASFCMDPPSSDEKIFNPIYFDPQPRGNSNLIPEIQFADTGYLNTFGIELVAVWQTSLIRQPDTVREILVNQAAVRKLGFVSPSQILGKTLSYNARRQYPIVGVIHDFSSRSLRDSVLPRWCCRRTKTCIPIWPSK